MKKLSLLLFLPTSAMAAVNIAMGDLVNDVIILIIVGLIFGLLIFLIRKAPFIPGEWKTGIEYFVYFIAVLIVINILLSMIGHPIVNLR